MKKGLKTDLRIRLKLHNTWPYIHIETKKECDLLMQIYRCAGLRWRGWYPKKGNKATEHEFYFRHKENTLVNIPHNHYANDVNRRPGYIFKPGPIEYTEKLSFEKWSHDKIISLEEFIKFQGISKKQIRRIKFYFFIKKVKQYFSKN